MELHQTDAICRCVVENVHTRFERAYGGGIVERSNQLLTPSKCPKHRADVAAGRRSYCCGSGDVIAVEPKPYICRRCWDQMNRDIERWDGWDG
jgi:hypothetical protein